MLSCTANTNLTNTRICSNWKLSHLGLYFPDILMRIQGQLGIINLAITFRTKFSDINYYQQGIRRSCSKLRTLFFILLLKRVELVVVYIRINGQFYSAFTNPRNNMWKLSFPETTSTHLFPVHPFSTPWKYQKSLRFSDVFRG